jgi:hypothetical protein
MLMMTADGLKLHAQYAVQSDGSRLELILESRSGTPPRNPDYKPALTLLLRRLALLEAVLHDALVDSRDTRSGGLSELERRIVEAVPIALADVEDVDKLRRRMGTLQSKVARSPNARGSGNSHRRICLVLEVPGYGPNDAMQLQQALALPTVVNSPSYDALQWLAGEAEREPNESDYAAATHLLGDLDRIAQVAQRIEQNYLRQVLFPDQTATCDLCGRAFTVEFLVAAHIKKRSACSEDERRDALNVVMAACKFGCDELYERGYVTVSESGSILLSDALALCQHAYLYARDNLMGRTFGKAMAKRLEYFAWHRQNRFKYVMHSAQSGTSAAG